MQRLLTVIKPFLLVFMLFQWVQPANAAENHDELFVLIGDSLMKAKEDDQVTVEKNIDQFALVWKSIKSTDSKQAKKVEEQLKEIQRLLGKGKVEKETLSKKLSALSSAVIQFDKEQNPVVNTTGNEKIRELLPVITKLEGSLSTGNQVELKAGYQALMNQWNQAEVLVHDKSIAAYGNIEKYMALIRIAITQEPANLEMAKTNMDNLTKEVDHLLAGKISKQSKTNYRLSDIAASLTNAGKAINDKEYKKAGSELNEILTIWPTVEGDVQTRDSRLYSDIETKIPTAISLLSSKNVDAAKAADIVQDIDARLAPLLSKTDYSLWDSALILLREGLEGLLIVVTLLAFLKKMDQSAKQKWIWAGVAAGIVASAILAIIINLVFTKIVAASSREYIEGITGIVAVIMMLTVGGWLHNKANIGNWNKYINQQMQQAFAKGSLFSFAIISFLSIFREGAETIIFYTGITPYISLKELVMGILLALIILAAVGFVIVYFSVKIPIRLFFKAATLFIYLLAFKILGISIHALQISNIVTTTTVEKFLFIDWIGLYPTWETTITQLILIVIIVIMTWTVRKQSVTVHS
jgi:high-affinity iron transporter